MVLSEPEPEPEPVSTAEETPKRRLFGRRRSEEAEPPALELEAEPEPEPVESYVDPWERDFEYAAPEEPENVVELDETTPDETTQEPLAAERIEVEQEDPGSNGSQLDEADEIPVTTAPRGPEYVPRRGRRR